MTPKPDKDTTEEKKKCVSCYHNFNETSFIMANHATALGSLNF